MFYSPQNTVAVLCNQCSLSMKNSANIQQSQDQMIQQAVASRNFTQFNGNTNKFWKGSHWFCY